MPTLFMVATPIGNLDDITTRALETLGRVSLVVCEDTRHSGRLLSHHGIRTRLLSAHSHNEEQRSRSIIAELERGNDVAYISDAGTPAISDPGRTLVRNVRDAGYAVSPIPGASALTALMSVNGFPGKGVLFEGFLSPRAGRRRTRLKELLALGEAFVLYESPHRVVKLLADMADLDSERPLLLGRELTKLHEEIMEGSAAEILDILGERERIRGECALLVGPPKKG